jgi:predicted permease
MRSFLRVLDVDMGYRPERAVALRIDPGPRYSTQPRRNIYFEEAIRRVQLLPGIQAAGLTDVLPLGGDRTWKVGAKGQIYSKDHPPPASFIRVVSGGYLVAAGIPLRTGRYFSERDTLSSEPVALINETLARLLWTGRNPLGQILAMDHDRTVVGVVGDVRHRALEDVAGPEIYLPIEQTDDYASVYMVVRTDLSPAASASAIRAALLPLEPNIARNEFRTLQGLVDRAVSPRRFVVVLLGGFSLFALLLAALGTYAVISYSVNQKTAELGIRMALGASARDLQRQITLLAIGLAGLGVIAGGATAWILTRAITSLLFGVTSTDPATFLGMFVVLTAAAGLAGYVPARRASRIDPLAALRIDGS